MYWHKNVIIFLVLAGVSAYAVTLPDKLLAPNCSAGGLGLSFYIRLAVYSALPIALHLLAYALFFPNLTAKRIVVVAGIFHLAVIVPFFLMAWGLLKLFGFMAGWWIFPEPPWLGLWHLILTLVPPSIIAITTTLWLLGKPFLGDVAARWKTREKVFFLLLMVVSIWALGVVQLTLTLGCL